MSDAPSRPVVQMIRRVAGNPSLGDRTDGELLALFVAGGGDAAFEAIVRRHGPMVLDVCRSLLPCEADAEDAFQATFLVLARKAGSIREAASLASWLYGVAYRSARRAREAFARRRRHEARAPQRPDPVPADDLTWREVRGVVHEELGRLPQCLRAALVLCYLQGKTQDEAAAELDLPKGTLKGRLERARALLHARLLRRGLGPAAVLVLSTCAPSVPAAELPPTLVGSSVGAATKLLGGHAVTGLVSVRATVLATGVQRAMSLSKLKTALVALALVGATCLGAYGLAVRSAPGGGNGRSGSPPGKTEPLPERPGAPVATDDAFKDKLPGPWGEEVKGLRCRITSLSLARGRYTVEIQNRSDKAIRLGTAPDKGPDSILLWWAFSDEGQNLKWFTNPYPQNELITPAITELPAGKSLLRSSKLGFGRMPGKHFAVKYSTDGYVLAGRAGEWVGEIVTGPVAVDGGNGRADSAPGKLPDKLPEPLDLTPLFLGDGLVAQVAPGGRPKVDGLVLAVEFEPGERLLGEPVLVRCSLANYGPKPVTLSYGHRSEQRNTIVFDITGPDGKPVPRLFLAERDSLGPQPRVLEPGWRLVEWYNLSDAYGLTTPGEYTVGARYESDGTSVNAGGGKRTDLWKGKLERSVGTVKIVEPSRAEDRAALAWLVANPPLGTVRPEYRYTSLFPPMEPGENPHFAKFLKDHGNSCYAAYARYADGLGALERVARGTTSYARQAVESLGAIDPAGYPALLDERRRFHLIQAHTAAGSKAEAVAPLVKDFLARYPDSPYAPLVRQAVP